MINLGICLEKFPNGLLSRDPDRRAINHRENDIFRGAGVLTRGYLKTSAWERGPACEGCAYA